MTDIESDPGALMEEGIRLAQTGNFAAASAVFRGILERVPSHAGATEGLGLVALEQGDAIAACDYFQRALEAGARADLLYNLGNAEAMAGRVAEAAESYRLAVGVAPDFIEAWFNLGEVLEKLDQLDASVAAYQKVVALDPALAPGHNNLGSVLTEAGRFEQGIASLKRAIDLDPAFPPSHTNLGNAFKFSGRLDDAIAAHREAIRLAPGYADARYNLGATLSMAGDFEGAEEMLASALEIKPELSRARLGLGAVRIGLGRAEKAVALCESAAPEDCEMLALKPFALSAAGRAGEARAFADYDRFVTASFPAPPAGYADMSTFNDALVAHVLEHPSLTHAPTSHATVNGRHTGNLLAEPKGPFAEFEAMLWQAVESFRTEMAAGPAHPCQHPRELGELVVWSIVMERGGHQVPHIHPTGWVSGVYYPKLPDFEARSSEPHAGWIEFGAPPPEIPFAGSAHTRLIEPQEGALLLFPSCFYHRTIPFDAPEPRVSIAFDFRSV